MIALDLLVEGAVKVSLLLAPALVAVWCMRTLSAATRHWVLSVAVLCALLLPAVWALGPTWSAPTYFTPVAAIWSVPAGLAEATTGPETGLLAPGGEAALADGAAPAVPKRMFRAGPTATGWPGIGGVVLWLWALGAASGLTVLALGLLRLRRHGAAANAVTDGPWRELGDEIGARLGLRRSVRLLQSRHPTLLATWGVVRPVVTLPAGAERWPSARMRVVLGHELAHVRRGDWALQLCGQLLCVVFWFNPLTWVALARLRRDSELACDDEVLRLGSLGPDYAIELLDLAKVLRSPRTGWSPVMAMARPSGLERRIAAMMNPSLRRHPLVGRTRVVVVLAALALTLPLAILAQSGSATVAGTVVDPSGAAWGDARIALSPVGQTLTLEGDVVVASDDVTIRADKIELELRNRADAEFEAQADTVEMQKRERIKREFELADRMAERLAARSDAGGRFTIPDVPPGDYRLTVHLPGFEQIEERVTLRAGQRLERDFSLRIGSIEEAITVASGEPGAGAPKVTTATPEGVARMKQRLAAGRLQPPFKLRDVSPVYPPSLADVGTDGVVTLDTLVTASGSVEVRTIMAAVDPDLLTPVQPELARAAVDAVRQWQYEPTRLNDMPVAVSMTVTVNFEGS